MYPRELETYVHPKPCTLMFTATSLIIAEEWKQIKCSSTDKWINKIWYMQTMECYLTIERNELLIHVQCGWTSKTSRYMKWGGHDRPHIVWFQWYYMSSIGQSVEIESELVIPGAGERGSKEWPLMYKISFWSDENLELYIYLVLGVMMVARFCKYTKNHWIGHLKERWILCYVNYISIFKIKIKIPKNQIMKSANDVKGQFI